MRENGQSINIDPDTSKPSVVPDIESLRILFEDAISQNSKRYGEIKNIDGTTVKTTTGIEIALDWNDLKFTQKGLDRAVIDTFYRIHYLQWTPWPVVNQVLGVVGLFLLATLTILGVRIYVANRE